MFWRNFAAYAVTSVFAFEAVSANAALTVPCWETGELPAARLHDFKTMLLVGALKCRDRAPGSLEGYNQFVSQKRSLIISSIHVVKARFIRDGGMTAGVNGFTDYETGLANHYSAMAHDDAFCGQVGTYARLAASASDEDIGVLAGAVAREPSTDVCGSEARPVAKPGMVAAIQPAVMTAAQPVEGESGAAPDAVEVAAVEATPVDSADAAEVVPIAGSAFPAAESAAEAPPAAVADAGHGQPKVVTPPAPSASHALAEAAKALAAAAAALDAQNADPAAASRPN